MWLKHLLYLFLGPSPEGDFVLVIFNHTHFPLAPKYNLFICPTVISVHTYTHTYQSLCLHTCRSLTPNPNPAASHFPFSDQTGLWRMIQCFCPQYHTPWGSYRPKNPISESRLGAKTFLLSWWRVLFIFPPEIMNFGGFSGSQTSWSNSKPSNMKPHENTERPSLKGNH